MVYITPPQGLIAIYDKKTIYGFPMGLPAGGGGTTVKITLPPSYKQGSGQKMILIGDYAPATFPPIEQNPHHQKNQSAGMRVLVATRAATPRSAGGCIARVIPDAEIVKVRMGSGDTPASVQVVTI